MMIKTGTLHDDRCTFCIISRSVLLRMRKVSDKSCRQIQNAHFMFNNFFSKIYYTIMKVTNKMQLYRLIYYS